MTKTKFPYSSETVYIFPGDKVILAPGSAILELSLILPETVPVCA